MQPDQAKPGQTTTKGELYVSLSWNFPRTWCDHHSHSLRLPIGIMYPV